MQEQFVHTRSKVGSKHKKCVPILVIFVICCIAYANSVAFEYSMHKVNADMYFKVKHNGKMTFYIGE